MPLTTEGGEGHPLNLSKTPIQRWQEKENARRQQIKNSSTQVKRNRQAQQRYNQRHNQQQTRTIKSVNNANQNQRDMSIVPSKQTFEEKLYSTMPQPFRNIAENNKTNTNKSIKQIPLQQTQTATKNEQAELIINNIKNEDELIVGDKIRKNLFEEERYNRLQETIGNQVYVKPKNIKPTSETLYNSLVQESFETKTMPESASKSLNEAGIFIGGVALGLVETIEGIEQTPYMITHPIKTIKSYTKIPEQLEKSNEEIGMGGTVGRVAGWVAGSYATGKLFGKFYNKLNPKYKVTYIDNIEIESEGLKENFINNGNDYLRVLETNKDIAVKFSKQGLKDLIKNNGKTINLEYANKNTKANIKTKVKMNLKEEIIKGNKPKQNMLNELENQYFGTYGSKPLELQFIEYENKHKHGVGFQIKGKLKPLSQPPKTEITILESIEETKIRDMTGGNKNNIKILKTKRNENIINKKFTSNDFKKGKFSLNFNFDELNEVRKVEMESMNPKTRKVILNQYLKPFEKSTLDLTGYEKRIKYIGKGKNDFTVGEIVRRVFKPNKNKVEINEKSFYPQNYEIKTKIEYGKIPNTNVNIKAIESGSNKLLKHIGIKTKNENIINNGKVIKVRNIQKAKPNKFILSVEELKQTNNFKVIPLLNIKSKNNIFNVKTELKQNKQNTESIIKRKTKNKTKVSQINVATDKQISVIKNINKNKQKYYGDIISKQKKVNINTENIIKRKTRNVITQQQQKQTQMQQQLQGPQPIRIQKQQQNEKEISKVEDEFNSKIAIIGRTSNNPNVIFRHKNNFTPKEEKKKKKFKVSIKKTKKKKRKSYNYYLNPSPFEARKSMLLFGKATPIKKSNTYGVSLGLSVPTKELLNSR